jgi:hypothetical protein
MAETLARNRSGGEAQKRRQEPIGFGGAFI